MRQEKSNYKTKKMDATQSIAKYSRAVQAMKAHQEENKPVFDRHKELMMQILDADNELRDAVAESGASISDDFTVVTVTPQTQTFADIVAIDKLIAEGKIPATLRAEIVKTAQRPPRITVGEKHVNK